VEVFRTERVLREWSDEEPTMVIGQKEILHYRFLHIERCVERAWYRTGLDTTDTYVREDLELWIPGIFPDQGEQR
jgi:hypothetical protein